MLGAPQFPIEVSLNYTHRIITRFVANLLREARWNWALGAPLIKCFYSLTPATLIVYTRAWNRARCEINSASASDENNTGAWVSLLNYIQIYCVHFCGNNKRPPCYLHPRNYGPLDWLNTHWGKQSIGCLILIADDYRWSGTKEESSGAILCTGKSITACVPQWFLFIAAIRVKWTKRCGNRSKVMDGKGTHFYNNYPR